MLAADLEGWPWLARLARGLQAAVLLAVAPDPSRLAAARDLIAHTDADQDRWTACLVGLALGGVAARLGQPDLAVTALSRAEQTATELDAPVLAAWAQALRAAVAAPGDPPADREHQSAVHRAAAVGITHVHALTALLEPAAHRSLQVEARRPPRRAAVPSPPGGVTLRGLGGFALTAGGVDVPWRTLRPRVRSLLMLLALRHGRPVHREQLVEALWPEATLASGVRSLQVAVSSIRHVLADGGITEDALCRHGDAYGLELPHAVDQVAEFERTVQAARRARGLEAVRLRLEALELYAGDLLPEVGPAEWVVEERARLRLLAAGAAAAAAGEATALGDLPTALAAARRSVELDPYHDSSWQQVVTINERLGDHIAAAVARREQARLWADLGLDPPATPAHRLLRH